MRGEKHTHTHITAPCFSVDERPEVWEKNRNNGCLTVSFPLSLMLSSSKLSHSQVTSCSQGVQSENRPRPLRRHDVTSVRRELRARAQGPLGNVGETYRDLKLTQICHLLFYQTGIRIMPQIYIFFFKNTWFYYRFSKIHTHTDMKRALSIRYFMFVNVLLMRHDTMLCMPNYLYYLDEFVLWPPENIFSH